MTPADGASVTLAILALLTGVTTLLTAVVVLIAAIALRGKISG